MPSFTAGVRWDVARKGRPTSQPELQIGRLLAYTALNLDETVVTMRNGMNTQQAQHRLTFVFLLGMLSTHVRRGDGQIRAINSLPSLLMT